MVKIGVIQVTCFGISKTLCSNSLLEENDLLPLIDWLFQ